MRCAVVAATVLLLGAGWPTASHDARRTSQSDVRGPRSAARTASVVLTAEQNINMAVTVADDGTLFAGTWGVVRSGGSSDVASWNKFDGKLFAYHRSLERRWTAQLDRVPYCYNYPGRPATDGCPNGGTVNGYNGTVEGTVALDAARGRLYVGRGDGRLYAIDTATGAIAWRFTSFNPVDPRDPEGGGEIVAGPLVAGDGTIFIASAAAGHAWETNAVYAVKPDGTLRWRYPRDAKSIAHVVFASPALSPDQKTIYVAGAWGPRVDAWETTVRGAIYALDAGTGALKWIFEPTNEAVWWKPTVWTTELAVGTDGTLYAAGTELTFGGGSAVVFALRDHGTSASYAWPRMVDIDLDRAVLANGLALRETGGVTRRVYATSGNGYSLLLQGYDRGGKLVAVDASSGSLLWRFDPETHGGTGAMTGIAIDSEGVVYTGVSGRKDGGRIFAIREDGSLVWQFTLGGLLEWAHPVLGPYGDLYAGDSRRCLLNAYPVETGVCNTVNIDPRIYVVWNDLPPRRRAVRR